MRIDLHVHTTASDGAHAPADVVRMAAVQRISVLGIADHDTVDGIDVASDAADRFGVRVVPAVEINSYRGGSEFHILGYFINHRDERLQAALAGLRRSRISRMRVIIDKLKALGIRLTAGEVLALSGGGAVGRPHIARALVNGGYVTSMREAFDTLIGDGKPAYAPRSKLTPEGAISIIRDAGGAAVLAHPGLWGADASIASLAAAGIAGIEAYSPVHGKEQVGRYLELARSLGLCVTGGSDFHGWHDSRRVLGAATTPPEEFKRLEETALGAVRAGENRH